MNEIPRQAPLAKPAKAKGMTLPHGGSNTKLQQEQNGLEKEQGQMRTQNRMFQGMYQAVGSKEESARAKANEMLFADNRHKNDAFARLGGVGIFGNLQQSPQDFDEGHRQKCNSSSSNLQEAVNYQPIAQSQLEEGDDETRSRDQQFTGSYGLFGIKASNFRATGMRYEDTDAIRSKGYGVGIAGIQSVKQDMEKGPTMQKPSLTAAGGMKCAGSNKQSSHSEAVTVLSQDTAGNVNVKFFGEQGQQNQVVQHQSRSSRTYIQGKLPGFVARTSEAKHSEAVLGKDWTGELHSRDMDLVHLENSLSRDTKEELGIIPPLKSVSSSTLQDMDQRLKASSAVRGSPDGKADAVPMQLMKVTILREHAGEIQQMQEVAEPRRRTVTRAASSIKLQMRRVKLESSNGISNVSAFVQEHSSQLERFLGVLVQADQRLIGSAVGHRIQIVDCTLGGEFGVDPLMEEVYGRISAILAQRDPWETRLGEVEAFVEEHGRLPRQGGKDLSPVEKVLGKWIDNQVQRLQQMPAHRLQRLLNSSCSLLRSRAEGWLAGGHRGAFERNCRELKKYIEAHGKLPRLNAADRKSLGHRLARWLGGLGDKGTWAAPERKSMLEQVHPLMKELVQKWSSTPLKRIGQNQWKKQLKQLVDFVRLHGRLPKDKVVSERSLYHWMRAQQRRLAAGILPSELAKQLTAAMKTWDEKVSKHGDQLQCFACVRPLTVASPLGFASLCAAKGES